MDPRPEWLATAHHLFLRTERKLTAAQKFHAAVMGTFLVSAMNLVFLFQHNPAHENLWFALSLFLLLPSVVLVPFTWATRRSLSRKRNDLARRFFEQGLSVDPLGRLVTLEAHSKVVLPLPAITESPPAELVAKRQAA